MRKPFDIEELVSQLRSCAVAADAFLEPPRNFAGAQSRR